MLNGNLRPNEKSCKLKVTADDQVLTTPENFANTFNDYLQDGVIPPGPTKKHLRNALLLPGLSGSGSGGS